MRWLVGTIGWVVEAGILAELVWKYRSSFDLRIHEDAWWLAPLVVLYVIIAVVQWRIFRRSHIARRMWLRLCLLTGPCALGSLLMAVDLSGRLSALAFLERDAAGARVAQEGETGALKDGTLLYSQERMESERVLYLMLCGGMCLLYAQRRSAAGNEGGWRRVG